MLNIGDGKFDYIDNHYAFRKQVLQLAWKAITDTNNWEYMATKFKFQTDIQYSHEVYNIYKRMRQLGYGKNQLALFSDCMRYMWQLATFGEDLFKIGIKHKVQDMRKRESHLLTLRMMKRILQQHPKST
jgi:hypothetical protein